MEKQIYYQLFAHIGYRFWIPYNRYKYRISAKIKTSGVEANGPPHRISANDKISDILYHDLGFRTGISVKYRISVGRGGTDIADIG